MLIKESIYATIVEILEGKKKPPPPLSPEEQEERRKDNEKRKAAVAAHQSSEGNSIRKEIESLYDEDKKVKPGSPEERKLADESFLKSFYMINGVKLKVTIHAKARQAQRHKDKSPEVFLDYFDKLTKSVKTKRAITGNMEFIARSPSYNFSLVLKPEYGDLILKSIYRDTPTWLIKDFERTKSGQTKVGLEESYYQEIQVIYLES